MRHINDYLENLRLLLNMTIVLFSCSAALKILSYGLMHSRDRLRRFIEVVQIKYLDRGVKIPRDDAHPAFSHAAPLQLAFSVLLPATGL